MMPTQQERAEMEEVLRSGIFEKAPRLGKFFSYICDRYFAGEAHQIKEYSIAVEALGRSEDFDPKKDSIVRVEAHRLRKRLEEYYQAAGAHHATRIIIPNGQYRPEFVAAQPVEEQAPLAVGDNGRPPTYALAKPGFRVVSSVSPISITTGAAFDQIFEQAPESLGPAPPSADPARTIGRKRPFLLIVASALLVVGVVGVAIHLRKDEVARLGQMREAVTADEPIGAEMRILTGYRGHVYVDRQGHTWRPDTFFSGGEAKLIPAGTHIEGQPDPHLIRSFRAGKFAYDIPLVPGTYELHLLFAETEFGNGSARGGGESTRLFRVLVNGKVLLPQIDSIAQAGAPNRMHEQVLKNISPASDNKLHLGFDPLGPNPAIVSGIEILPTSPGRIHPVRLITQPTPVTDSDGRVWAADEYFLGGAQADRANTLVDPTERFLYQGERFGNFAYRIPLAPGKYKLTLHFAEQWFGTLFSGMQPVTDRAFDVFSNRVPLVRNFTPGRAAGGPNRPVALNFEKIEPNVQGVLLLEFVPVRNYAEINAIEVVETQ